MTLSVIIPTLNEQSHIERCLAQVYAELPYEIIVADGGSDDATGYLAKKAAARVLGCERNIAQQCNQGAGEAAGEVLLFLAADTAIGAGYSQAIFQCLSDPKVSVGGFRLKIEDRRVAFRVIEFGGNLRSWWYGFTLPDQGLFVRKSDYFAVGGMRPNSLIPFADLCERLKTRGRFQGVSLLVGSSSRKWRNHGIIKTCLSHSLTFFRFRRQLGKVNR